MLGLIEQCPIVHAGFSQRRIDRFASSIGNVRVFCSENHQEFTANFLRALQRSGICVLTELAVMQARRVVADRGAYIGLERGTKREVTADTETRGADFSRRDLGMPGEPIQTSPAVGIKMRDRSVQGVLLAARLSGVIEWDHRSGGLNPPINFRCGDNKSVPGQPNASAQRRGS